jgi:hypothetical protein
MAQIILTWLFLLSFQIVRAQENSSSVLVDSFVYSNSEDASARLDYWRIELDKSPQTNGYVIVYGGRISKRGEIEAHFRGLKQAFKLKGIDEKRVSLIKGGFREKLTVEFWVVPEKDGTPRLTPTVELSKVRLKGASRKIIPYECCF